MAEIEEFFEDEKLDVANERNAPVLTKRQLAELPVSLFAKTQSENNKDQMKCTICQMEFEDGDEIRTLRCLHIFHKPCIDKWLTTRQGSCVLCMVVQVDKRLESGKNGGELSPVSEARRVA